MHLTALLRAVFLGTMSSPCSQQQPNAFCHKAILPFCLPTCNLSTEPLQLGSVNLVLLEFPTDPFHCIGIDFSMETLGWVEWGEELCKILNIHSIAKQLLQMHAYFPKSCFPPSCLLMQSFVHPVIAPGKFSANCTLSIFHAKAAKSSEIYKLSAHLCSGGETDTGALHKGECCQFHHCAWLYIALGCVNCYAPKCI